MAEAGVTLSVSPAPGSRATGLARGWRHIARDAAHVSWRAMLLTTSR
jgi:hypothetical protein